MSKQDKNKKDPKDKEDFSYPASEDIYNNAEEEQDMDPENPGKKKTPNDTDERDTKNEKGFADHESGRDLDIPGSDLDDAQEDNGMEDEENNSYSIGGDRHDDLEEDKGD